MLLSFFTYFATVTVIIRFRMIDVILSVLRTDEYSPEHDLQATPGSYVKPAILNTSCLVLFLLIIAR